MYSLASPGLLERVCASLFKGAIILALESSHGDSLGALASERRQDFLNRPFRLKPRVHEAVRRELEGMPPDMT